MIGKTDHGIFYVSRCQRVRGILGKNLTNYLIYSMLSNRSNTFHTNHFGEEIGQLSERSRK